MGEGVETDTGEAIAGEVDWLELIDDDADDATLNLADKLLLYLRIVSDLSWKRALVLVNNKR